MQHNLQGHLEGTHFLISFLKVSRFLIVLYPKELILISLAQERITIQSHDTLSALVY